MTSISLVFMVSGEAILAIVLSAARNSAAHYLIAVYLCKGFRRKLRCYSVGFGFFVNAVPKSVPFPTVRPRPPLCGN